MNLTNVLEQVIAILKVAIPLLGKNVQDATERAFTLPEKDVNELCKGMSEEDKAEAIRLARVAADGVSDFVVFVASRGQIEAD